METGARGQREQMYLGGCSPLLPIASALPEKPHWAAEVSGMQEFGGPFRKKKRTVKIKGKRMFLVGLRD